MAEPGSTDWTGIFYGLSPQLQGIVLFGLAIGGGIFLGRRYLKRLMTEPQQETKVFAVGEPTSFTNMKPIFDLLENVNVMTLQAQKNEHALGALMGVFQESHAQLNKSLERVADVATQLMQEFRDQRQIEADAVQRQEYIDEGKQLARDEIANKRRAKLRPSRAIQHPTSGEPTT